MLQVLLLNVFKRWPLPELFTIPSPSARSTAQMPLASPRLRSVELPTNTTNKLAYFNSLCNDSRTLACLRSKSRVRRSTNSSP